MGRLFTSAVAAVIVGTASAAPADAAIRYLGTRSIGTGTVDLAIDTDGKVGVLAASNILAWTVTLHDAGATFPVRTLTNAAAGGGTRSSVAVAGNGVTATRTALSFEFGPGSLEFDADYTVRPFYQIVSSLCSTGRYGNDGGCEQFDTGGDFSSQHVQYTLHSAGDTIVIATAAAVPEPNAWALMIVGFGLAGRSMRRRGSGRARHEPATA